MASTTKREYRESLDMFLLITAFVAGVGFALILKVMGFPPYIPALAAGAVIIIYAVATYTSSAARLEPEQIGDNCYYLGFCITLASLAYTLYALGSAGSDAAMLGDVISGFGIALSSTVVGVMARVVLLQFRVDLAARDKEARSQLNQVMRLFHSEMQTSVSSTRETIVQIRQTLEEHTEATIEYNKRMQKSFETRIEALVEEAVNGVKTAMHEVVESGKDMNKRISASSRENMATAEKAMTASIETITEELRHATETLEAEMQRANASSVKSLENIVMEVSAAMKLTSEEASKAIAAAREQQNTEMTKAVGSVAENVFEMARQIGAQKEKIGSALEEFTKETRAVREEVGAMVKESAVAREDARKSAQITADATRKLTSAAEKIEKSAQATASAGPPNAYQTPVGQAPASVAQASPKPAEPAPAALPADSGIPGATRPTDATATASNASAASAGTTTPSDHAPTEEGLEKAAPAAPPAQPERLTEDPASGPDRQTSSTAGPSGSEPGRSRLGNLFNRSR